MITILNIKGNIGQPEGAMVYAGRWDGITAQTKDPQGTVECQAHMGKQAADELLAWASHHDVTERGRAGEKEIDRGRFLPRVVML